MNPRLVPSRPGHGFIQSWQIKQNNFHFFLYRKDSEYFVNKKFSDKKLSPEHPDSHRLYYIGGIMHPCFGTEPFPYDFTRPGSELRIIPYQRAVHVQRLIRLGKPRGFPVNQHLRDIVISDVFFIYDLTGIIFVFRMMAGAAAMDIAYPLRAKPRRERVKSKFVHIMEPVCHLAGELPLDNSEHTSMTDRIRNMCITIFDIVNQYVNFCSHTYYVFNSTNISIMFDIWNFYTKNNRTRLTTDPIIKNYKL